MKKTEISPQNLSKSVDKDCRGVVLYLSAKR